MFRRKKFLLFILLSVLLSAFFVWKTDWINLTEALKDSSITFFSVQIGFIVGIIAFALSPDKVMGYDKYINAKNAANEAWRDAKPYYYLFILYLITILVCSIVTTEPPLPMKFSAKNWIKDIALFLIILSFIFSFIIPYAIYRVYHDRLTNIADNIGEKEKERISKIVKNS